jgi:hypothetical protein
MNAEVDKAKREKRVFQDFIKKSGLSINRKSVESCNLPNPDILCLHESEGYVAFELVEVCDPNIAKAISALRNDGGVLYIRGSDPSLDVLRKKFTKPYNSEYPIELLCTKTGERSLQMLPSAMRLTN